MEEYFKTILLNTVAERVSWALNDSATFLFAKSSTEYSRYEDVLGGGNMATPLILFPVWDVLAGVYARCSDHAQSLLWSDESLEPLSGSISEVASKIKDLKLTDHVRLIQPRIGEPRSDSEVLQVYLQDHIDLTILGVPASRFAHGVRTEFRNKLAHTFAPMFGKAATSTRVYPQEFRQLLAYVRAQTDPVIELGDDGTTLAVLNAVPMWRDTERLARHLMVHIQDHATEDQSHEALRWLGYPVT